MNSLEGAHVLAERDQKRIIICGPIARPGQPSRGGFQSANLRLASVLETLGFRVECWRYWDGDGNILKKSWSHFRQYMRLAWLLAMSRSKSSAVHFTPLLEQFIALEFVLFLVARIKGYRIVLDLRAGGRFERFTSRARVYRFLVKRALETADFITFEGLPYDEPIGRLAPHVPRRYLPNFVPASLLHQRARSGGEPGPQLIYVGQLSEPKGIREAAMTLAVVQGTFPSAGLTLVGRSVDPDLDQAIESIRLPPGALKYTGALTFDEILAALDRSHYFVFLSRWRSEGHSNALTEAMARGCVPVCTDQGFNAQVVGDSGLVARREDTPATIAQWITSNWMKEFWLGLSRKSVSRVEALFTDEAVRKILQEIYTEEFFASRS